MSTYFDRVQNEIGYAVNRGVHKPWYLRIRAERRARTLVVVLAALVVATPAVGAVTNWFGIGAPNHPQSEAQAFGVGNAIPGATELLPLRVPDPQGGPPWGIRVVSTQTGSCQEIGRVEDGQLGSLGIDHYWNDDHLFHPFPTDWVGQTCGSSGNAPGGGALGVETSQFDAGANIPSYRAGVQLTGCAIGADDQGDRPSCPTGSGRIVIAGVLGFNVRSITYEQPDHTLATEQTAGKDGAFLLVFQVNAANCRLYLQDQLSSDGRCARTVATGAGTSHPVLRSPFTAIKAITFRNGQTCPREGFGMLTGGSTKRCPR